MTKPQDLHQFDVQISMLDMTNFLCTEIKKDCENNLITPKQKYLIAIELQTSIHVLEEMVAYLTPTTGAKN